MAIYINKDTNVLVQGITGNQGTFHTKQMIAYGTKVVAGVSPGKGGQNVDGIPVYDSVAAAVENHKIDASILFVPAAFAKDGAYEAINAGIKVIVLLPEHIPLHDAMAIMEFAKAHGTIVVGPNTFGLVSAGQCKIGIMPNDVFGLQGDVGVVARSGTLSYEIVGNLTNAGLGTSTVVGLGGDRVVGLNFIDALAEFQNDPQTKAIVLVGEIGGTAEEDAAEFIRTNVTKPVVACITGTTGPDPAKYDHV